MNLSKFFNTFILSFNLHKLNPVTNSSKLTRTGYSFYYLTGVFLFLFITYTATAQHQPKPTRGYLSPGGLFDTVIDRYGNKYSLGEIRIDEEIRAGRNGTHQKTTASTCSSGYFQLYLENGCGLEGTDAASVARLNVVCQVLNDISSFVISPLTGSPSGQKINIWVRNISNFGPAAVNFAGLATSFYKLPHDNTGAISGIADNTVWITAISGIDAYKNVTSPLAIPGGYVNTSTYYHGVIAFQYGGPINWHTDLTTYPAAGETDLYTVALHEILHSLGFESAIDYNGLSNMGSGYNYFTRYDRHLTTQSGTNLITCSSSATCDMYNWRFNPSLTPFSVLSPGGTSSSCPSGYLSSGFPVNHTVCSNANKYVGGTTQPIYSPSCYEKGSSLSHFEDECSVPAGFPLAIGSASNDQYFLMANQSVLGPYSATTNPGACKRSLSPEERLVLCDMGYKVNTVFGNAVNLNNVNYGGTASLGVQVAGICDGINSGGSYSFFTTPGTSIQINGGASGSILTNDYGAASFKCLDIVAGSGTVSASAGTSGTSVTYTPSVNDFGVQLLRYIPVSSAGDEGNITYIYVYVGDTSCVASSCDMVSNGDFEHALPDSCGDIAMIPTELHCWLSSYGSPDLYTRSCTGGDIPYLYTTPPTEVFNYPTPGNNHFLGFYGEYAPTAIFIGEGMQGPLTPGMIPGNEYYIGFWVKNANIWPAPLHDHHIQVAVSPSVTPLAPLGYFITGIPTGCTALYPFVVPGDANWHYLSKKIKYTGDSIGNTLLIYDGTFLDPVPTGAGDTQTYTYNFFDDISVKPVSAVSAFNVPPTICLYDTILDLSSTVSVPGGVFTWDSVYGGASIYPSHSPIFNALRAYNASMTSGYGGWATISYHYTDVLGCSQTVYAQTHIILSTYTPITGTFNISVGYSVTLNNVTTGGRWISDDNSIATVDSLTGVVTGVSYGTVIIYYRLPSGCMVSATIMVNTTGIAGIQNGNATASIFPNPNRGEFQVKGTPGTSANQGNVTIQVTNLLGKVVYSLSAEANNGIIDTKIKLPDNTAAGTYIVRLLSNNSCENLMVSVVK